MYFVFWCFYKNKINITKKKKKNGPNINPCDTPERTVRPISFSSLSSFWHVNLGDQEDNLEHHNPS